MIGMITFKVLGPGDLIRHIGHDTTVYTVIANYGTRVTAVAVADVTNPQEWELVAKAKIQEAAWAKMIVE